MSGLSKKVVVAMSGGIDSSVAAFVLKQQGYDCIGVFMRNWDVSDEQHSATMSANRGAGDVSTQVTNTNGVCTINIDRAHMKQVCQRLEIPDYEVNFVKEYWNSVFEPFVEGLVVSHVHRLPAILKPSVPSFCRCQSGTMTPNPDVYCNRFVKFKHFRDHVQQSFGITKLATGHYARLQHENGTKNPILLRAQDHLKDQTYFLSLTNGINLQDVIFPLGGITKQRVREIAAVEFAGMCTVRATRRPRRNCISCFIECIG
jgi:tRNA-specific 2-thiouridylase